MNIWLAIDFDIYSFMDIIHKVYLSGRLRQTDYKNFFAPVFLYKILNMNFTFIYKYY